MTNVHATIIHYIVCLHTMKPQPDRCLLSLPTCMQLQKCVFVHCNLTISAASWIWVPATDCCYNDFVHWGICTYVLFLVYLVFILLNCYYCNYTIVVLTSLLTTETAHSSRQSGEWILYSHTCSNGHIIMIVLEMCVPLNLVILLFVVDSLLWCCYSTAQATQ